MESFACLIQTHTGQDKEGTERGRDGKGERDRGRVAEKQTGRRKKNTKYKKERLLRQVDREERTRERE